MRLARRAALLVAFCLLVSAATAYAECAWVLWERSGQYVAGTSDTPKLATEPVRSYEKRADCERMIVKQLTRFRTEAVGKSVRVFDDLQEAYVTTQTSDGKTVTMLTAYTCFPDTVDPRGPKGK